MTDQSRSSHPPGPSPRAVSREVSRQRRRLSLYLALILVPLAAMIAVLIYGYTEADRTRLIAEGVAKEAADSAFSDPVIEARVVPLVKSAVQLAARDPSLADEMAKEVLDSPRFQDVDRRLFEHVEKVTQRRVAAVRTELRDEIQGVQAQATAAKDLAKTAESHVSILSGKSFQDHRVDELSQRVASIEEQVRRIVIPIQRHDGPPWSFVVKERGTSELPGAGLTVTLGRRLDRGVTRLEIREGDAIVLATGSAEEPVPFGRPIELTTQAGRRFELTLGYALSRRLARDYIGIEIVRTPPD